MPLLPAAQPREFQAGAAASNITPPLGEPIVGGWTQPPAEHIHDELHARCLVLHDGNMQIAIVVVDNVGVPRYVLDQAKRLAQEQTGIPSERILISATHTHSASTARGEDRFQESGPLDHYQEFLVRRIADGIQRAVNNLEPARIAWGSGSLPGQVFNRRWFLEPDEDLTNPFGGTDQVKMNPGAGNPNLLMPAGPTDPEIAFLSVQSRDGRPIALLANYSLHYVGGVPRGEISADYFGVFADRMTELLRAERQNPAFVAIMSNGTSGDVNNIPFGQERERQPPYGQMNVVANQVAAEVFKAYRELEYQEWVPLRMAQRELSIVTRKPTPELLTRARKILARPENAEQGHVRERVYAERTLSMNESPPEVPALLQTIRIGDLAITAIPFEVFAEIGLELKEKSPFPQTFNISLANGAYGYLPTPRQHKLGGYETWLGTNRVEVEASTKIVQSLLELLRELR